MTYEYGIFWEMIKKTRYILKRDGTLGRRCKKW